MKDETKLTVMCQIFVNSVWQKQTDVNFFVNIVKYKYTNLYDILFYAISR